MNVLCAPQKPILVINGERVYTLPCYALSQPPADARKVRERPLKDASDLAGGRGAPATSGTDGSGVRAACGQPASHS